MSIDVTLAGPESRLGHEFRQIGLASIPLAASGVLASVLGLIDAYCILLTSRTDFAALSLTVPVAALVFAVGIAIGSALVSAPRALQGRPVIGAAVLLGAAAALLCMIAVPILTPALIERSIAEGGEAARISGGAMRYLWVLAPCFGPQIALAIAFQSLTARKQLKRLNTLLLLIVCVNLVITPLAVFVLGLGVQGAAFGTDLAYLSGVLALAAPSGIAPARPSQLLAMLRQGLPALGWMLHASAAIFASVSITLLASVALGLLAAKLSLQAVVLFGVFDMLRNITTLPTRGIAGAFLVRLSEAIAGRQREQYFPIYWAATGWIAIIYGAEAIALIAFPQALSSLFRIEAPAPMIRDFFVAIAVLNLVSVLPRAAQVGFLPLGRPSLVFLHSLIFTVCAVLSAICFIGGRGILAIVWGQALGLVLCTLIFTPLFFRYLGEIAHAD
jgi:Na+-driven multidrug efflux pump